MTEPTKKISFGFGKLAKKTSIVSTLLNKINPEDDVSKVEFIDCLEGKSIKLKDPIKVDEGPLIIPLKRSKEKDSNQQTNATNIENVSGTEGFGVSLKNKSNETKDDQESNKADEIIQSNGQTEKETLEEIAAREILEELKQKKNEDDENRVFSVPLTSNAPSGEKESTLEDYKNVPVGEFGMAMLRGMGWAPGKGIGKKEMLVVPTLPTPRPKGMGLGADKVIKTAETKSSNEELKMVKGCYIRILAGPEKDSYGQIEGFDDESGRLIVKLALKNISISLNEFMVQLVSVEEFKKNSKVINASKYQQYKDNEEKKESTERMLREEGHEKSRDRVHSSPHQSKKLYDKPKVLKNTSSSESEEETRSARSKISPRRSIKSPSVKDRTRERSRSRDHKYKSKPSDGRLKQSESYNRDRNEYTLRSNSSDSSESSRTRTSDKKKFSSSKTRRSPKDSSVSRRRCSSNSSTSDSSVSYSRMKKSKQKEIRSSSNKNRLRSRSRSPKRHKHKKSKKSREFTK